MNDSAIEVRKLNKKFGKKVVFNDFNLSVKEGTFTTIYGESGSGKSTLLDIIGMLEKYDSGNIKIFADTLPNINGRKSTLMKRNTISYIFQDFGLIQSSTIKANLDIGLAYQHLKSGEKKAIEEDVLNKVGLNYGLNTKVALLSGGEQQRVAVARTIIKPSKIILADEPTGSLDPENRDRIAKLLILLKDSGKTILTVSHDSYFKQISDQIVTI